jgi:hypothetical protein
MASAIFCMKKGKKCTARLTQHMVTDSEYFIHCYTPDVIFCRIFPTLPSHKIKIQWTFFTYSPVGTVKGAALVSFKRERMYVVPTLEWFLSYMGQPKSAFKFLDRHKNWDSAANLEILYLLRSTYFQ